MDVITDELPFIEADDELCSFCEAEPDVNYGSPDNPQFCEGTWCNNALEAYQEDFEVYFTIKERRNVLKCQMN